MPQVVEFEGQQHEFPDDFSQDEIATALGSVKAPKQAGPAPSWGEVGKSLLPQAQAAFKATGAGLRQMTTEEEILQRQEAVSPPGLAETEGGAVTGFAPPKAVERQQLLLERAQADRDRIATEAKAAREELKAVTPQDQTFWQQVASSVVQSAPPTLAGLGVGILTKNPLLAMAIAGGGGGVMQGQSTYGEALEKGATQRQALRAGGIDAVLEGIGEAIPLRAALKTGTPLFKRIFNTIAQEAGQEAATQAMQDFHAFLTYNPDITLQEAWQNVKVAAASGAVMGGAVGGIAHLADTSRKQPEGQIGPSGEMINGGIKPDLIPPTTPPAPPTAPPPGPAPVPTQPITTDMQALLDSIDKTLADPEAITDEQLALANQQLAAFEKARNAPARPENAAMLAGLDTLSPEQELGQSAKSMRNAPNYAPNPNDGTPRSKRTVVYSTAPGVETGFTLDKTELRPGVHVVGQPTTDREMVILQTAADTLEPWRAKWLPDRPLLLVNESLPAANATGWHWTNGNVHAITPAVLRKFTGQGAQAFNANAQATFFYNLTHEFGHSLIEDRFLNEGLPQPLTQALKAESSRGAVSEGTLAALEAVDPARAAVVREYNSIRERVVNGQMTAQEFLLEWMGPHQAGRTKMFGKHDYALPVPNEAPAMQLVDKILQRAVGSKTALPMEQLAPMRNAFLSLHEYTANQMARYAYARKLDETSPFNKDTLFARAFQSLRQALAEFFSFLKREGDIAPNTTFAEWLDGLSTTGDRTAKPGKKTSTTKEKKARLAMKGPNGKPLVFYRGLSEPAHLPVNGPVYLSRVKAGAEEYAQWSSDLYRTNIRTVMTVYIRDGLRMATDRHIDALGLGEPSDAEVNNKIWAELQQQGFDGAFYTEQAPYQGPGSTLDIFEAAIVFNPANVIFVKSQNLKPKTKPVVELEHNTATQSEDKVKYYRSLVTGLVRNKTIDVGDDTFKRLMGLLKAGDYSTFVDEIQPMLEKTVRFELSDDDGIAELEAIAAGTAGFSIPSVDTTFGLSEYNARKPEVVADAQAQWKRLGFRSPYFKAWFGDWEQGEGSRAITVNGKPLALYHASRAKVTTPRGQEPFVAFNKGDIGFHFGTLRAAHNRGYGQPIDINAEPVRENGRWVADAFVEKFALDTPFEEKISKSIIESGTYIIPTVLNIRNPLIFGEEDPPMWNTPVRMLNLITKEHPGIFTPAEEIKILLKTSEITNQADYLYTKFDEFRPLREALIDKGYDGIRYINTGEGDISWVVFMPEQVKSLLGNKTFSQSKDFHWEFDFDRHTPEGNGASEMNRNFGKDMPAQFRRSLRWVTGFFANSKYKIFQLQQLAHIMPQYDDLVYMNEKNYDYNRRKGALQAPPDNVVSRWGDLGKENFARMNKFLLDEFEGGQLWVDLVPSQTAAGRKTWAFQANATTLEQARKHNIDPDTPEGQELVKLILDAKNALLQQVNEGEIVMEKLLSRNIGANHAALLSAFTKLRREIHDVRKRPFFPQGRFGNYVLTVETKRDAAPGYEVVYREAFENQEDWRAAWEKANSRAKPDERVRKYELTDTEYVMMSLPQDFIELAVSELGLTEEQRDKLIAITQPVRREKVLKAYDQTRLGIKGYSADAMRSFADFTWHNANLLAKLEYRSEFNLAIQNLNSKLRAAQYSDDPASVELVQEMTQIKRFMERTRDFIMSPPNEAHVARALVSIAYLGFNVKTAMANFFGLVTTWSDLTTKAGMIEGNRIFLRSLQQMWSSFRLTNLNEVQKVASLAPDTQTALDRAAEEGVVVQSYAYHLAGMANASNLFRLPSKQAFGKMTHQAIDLAMWAFRLAELGTRRATFIAQYELARRDQNLGFQDAYTAAVTATNVLQNDYSLGNRPPFMRGIKTQSGNKLIEGLVPMATIFMTFTQNMAFHAYGGYELGLRRKARSKSNTPNSIVGGYTMKIWAILLLLAGYESLPGAENFLDLLDALWKKWFKKPARQDIREFVKAVGVDPVAASRGISHNIAGFDVSRSIGLGRMVPGTDVLSRTQTDFDTATGRLAFDLAGPAGNMLHWGLTTVFTDKALAESMRRAPGVVGNAWNAYQWSQHGLRTTHGAKVSFDLETGLPRDLTTVEIFGKVLGFNPTIVSQNREVLFQQHDMRMFWTTRRDRLLDDMWTASWQRDREAIADVNKAIQQFNSEIPDDYKRSLRITPRDIFNSRRSRERAKRLEEMKLPAQRRYRELYRDVRESFEAP